MKDRFSALIFWGVNIGLKTREEFPFGTHLLSGRSCCWRCQMFDDVGLHFPWFVGELPKCCQIELDYSGVFFQDGRVVYKDMHQSLIYYRLATELNCKFAMKNLSMIFKYGEGGIEKSDSRSKYWNARADGSITTSDADKANLPGLIETAC